MAGQPFDPANLPQFSVIHVRTVFGDEEPSWKMWVVLGHQDGCVVCIKATSQTGVYENNPAMREGCVMFQPGEVRCFPQLTAIDPENQRALPYRDLPKQLGAEMLPPGFREQLLRAIEGSPKLSRKGKRLMRDWIAGAS